jgi:hypothetical protein
LYGARGKHYGGCGGRTAEERAAVRHAPDQ